MSYQPGDVVRGPDPFRSGENPRPWLILNHDSHPFGDEEYMPVTRTTDRAIVTSDDATSHVLESESPALQPRTTNTVSEWPVEPAGTENRLTPFKIHVLSKLSSAGPG